MEPAQSTEFLDFFIDSTKISAKIHTDKSKTIMNEIGTFLSNLQPKIRDLASVIGTLVSLFPAMSFGKLYYRNLEKKKIVAPKPKKGNYNTKLHKLGKEAKNELQW